MNLDISSLGLREKDGFCLLALKVIPRSSRNKIVGVENGVLKLKIQAPPVEGAANDAVRRVLSNLLGKAQSTIEVIKGQRSRHKVVSLKGTKAAEVLEALQKLKS